jgi:outer membrane protein assembly factor BamA
MRRASLAGVLLVAAACGHAPPVHRPGETFVAAIELHGNHVIDDDTLLAGMALQRAYDEGRGVDPYELSQDAQRIEGLYDRRGYFNVHVDARVDRRGLAETPAFTIDEGPRATLARVEITGLPDDSTIPAATLRALIATEDGEPFDYDAYDDAKPQVLLAVQDAGYARAKLNATVVADRDHHEAVIRLELAPGPRCVFGDVTIKGVDGVLADAAHGRAEIEPGAHYSTTALAKTRGALYEMARFSTVRVDPDLTRADDVVPVEISVAVSSQPNELRAGIGVGIDPLKILLVPHVGYTRARWPTDLTTFGATFTPAFATTHSFGVPEGTAVGNTFLDHVLSVLRLQSSVSLTRIDLGRPRLTGQVAIDYQYVTIEAYTYTGPQLRLGLSSPIGVPQVQAHVGWQARVLGFVNINPIVDDATRERIHIDATEEVVAFDQSLTADFRDSAFEPRRGVYAALRLEEGVPAFGTPRFVQVVPDLRGYLPIGPVVVSARARIGAFWGTVPATERFYGGGASSQRGFPERQLSPVAMSLVNGDVESVVIGGAGEIETGAEVRTALPAVWKIPSLIAALFLDGGDVTNTVDALDPTNLHWAAGTGLRYSTKYGTARLDFAYRLNRYGPGEPLPDERFAYQIGFGEAF